MQIIVTLNNYDLDLIERLKKELFPDFSISTFHDESNQTIQMAVAVNIEEINYVVSMLSNYDITLSVSKEDREVIIRLISNLEKLI
jgi:hypothetical protein